MPRQRLRDLGIKIGEFPTGQYNAITDVSDIWVGHTTCIADEPRVARTGVTVIVPRQGEVYHDQCYGAYYSFNGNGEMTGIHWLEEGGLIGAPLAITNTHQVGLVRDALVDYEIQKNPENQWLLPIVAETYDGWLNDINAFHLTKADVLAALHSAQSGPVAEGNVGGGTGMICHQFKGGIGTASRLVATQSGNFTVGTLVQANYGARRHLRVNGAPVGQLINTDQVPPPRPVHKADGSIIVIVATDAPLLPHQCKRLAQRATVGLARVGGTGYNGSGDIFLAFATGNHVPLTGNAPVAIHMLPNQQMDPLFDATAEAVEEAILNALCMAETMVGQQGRTAHALPLDLLQSIMARYS
ncbi:MAG: P1 family peptidase [Caldilineaceae bacterium]|nr:P1 family peptidase [Caldilineaceae bacterium]